MLRRGAIMSKGRQIDSLLLIYIITIECRIYYNS